MGVDTRPVPIMILRWPKIRKLPTLQKFIYSYLYFNPDVTSCGCYIFGIDSCAADLNINKEIVEDALNEFCKLDLVAVDNSTGEIFVVGWIRWHRFIGPKALGALWSSIEQILSAKLLIKVKNTYKSTQNPAKGKEKSKGKTSYEEETRLDTTSSAKFPDYKKRSRPSKSESLIRCWTLDDKKDAVELEEKFGKDAVKKAVENLERDYKDPLPSRVRAELQKNINGIDLPLNWWKSDAGTYEVANILEMQAHTGEFMNEFRARIRVKLEEKRKEKIEKSKSHGLER